MAVFGLSARADCFESLEKRVKSRCQSRVHHILPVEETYAGTPRRVKQALLIQGQEAEEGIQQEWNDSVEVRADFPLFHFINFADINTSAFNRPSSQTRQCNCN